MRTRLPLFALAVVCGLGCATENAGTAGAPAPPTAEYCPATFDECVELCRPEGVRHFGCWSQNPDEDFECECLDGTSPFDPSELGGTIVYAQTERGTPQVGSLPPSPWPSSSGSSTSP